MSILVLSACSGAKAIDDPDISCVDIDSTSRSKLVSNNPEISMPAESLYTGSEHEYVKEAVNQLSEVGEVEWRIISAGFGLVSPETNLPAYECTFRDSDSVRRRAEGFGYDTDDLTKAQRIQKVGKELGISSDVEQLLKRSFDLVFVVLSRDYVLSTGSVLSMIPDETTAFAFAANGNRDIIGDCEWVPSTEAEREALNTVWTRLKGLQLRNVANSVSSTGDLRSLQTGESVREASLSKR